MGDDAGTEATAVPILKIGHVANMLGVPTARIRLWEHEGLVAPSRTDTGQRRYSMRDVKHLERVRKLLESKSMTFVGVRNALAASPGRVVEEDAPGADLVGVRAKQLRSRSGLSLRDLAARVQMSPSALSAFERGMSKPSIGRISDIAHALDVTVPDLLGTPRSQDKMIVRADRREHLEVFDEGVSIELLYQTSTTLQSQWITVEPGCGVSEPITHRGEDFVTVIEGSITVVLNAIETFHLSTGDSMTFDSTRPHAFHNRRDVTTRLVWVNTPPTF